MVVEEHAEDELQRLLSALSTADVLGLELLFALGPNCDVASMRGAVQVARLESLLKVVKKFEQPELMPEGMRAEEEASATAANTGITAMDFMA